MKRRNGASAARSNTATGTTATAEADAGRAPARLRGRFAPSPTGPLHVGSLFAAVGSYLDARARGGEWLLRIEDVDRAREVPGAADGILHTLEQFGLQWDGPVRRQSDRSEAYEAALAQLTARGLVYSCSCTRAEVAGTAARDDGVDAPELRYGGRCRRGPARPEGPLALRYRTEGAAAVTVDDRLQPSLTQAVDVAVGDFTLKRRDGFYAYQLAVVVDDADQGVTDVVRGLDLYDNTPRQVLLQRSLGLPLPQYLHLPLVVDTSGAKLSKSRRALPADAAAAPAVLTYILSGLRHPPPGVLRGAPPASQLEWAVGHWNPSKIQGLTSISSEF